MDLDTSFLSTVYSPSLCIALQGYKLINFGGEFYTYNKDKFLLVSTHIPATVRIKDVSKQNPYVALKLTFTLDEIYEVSKAMDPVNTRNTSLQKGLFLAI